MSAQADDSTDVKIGSTLSATGPITDGVPMAAWQRRRIFGAERETVRKALADQNPLDPQAARTPEEANLDAALNEELSLAILGKHLYWNAPDILMWAQDNPLDSEVVGRYRTARAGLATILSQAGLDPVGWQGRLETLKGMASRQRIKRLASWLLDAADPSHTSDDAERYVRGVLAPETPEARAELLKDFVPLLAVPGKRLRVIVGYEMSGAKYFPSTKVGVAVGNGEEPGEIADMQPTYTKGLPFTATCTIDKDGRTLYGMVPRELRAIDESPSALTATVNGRDVGPGDRVIYTTGTLGTDEVEGTVEQVVRGGENWAFVLRVERDDADSATILVTEPRIGALRSLETPENDTKNNTVRGDTPQDVEATPVQAIVNAVNGFTWTGADGVTWTARLIGCDENTPGTYSVEAAIDADDERAGSLDFDVADGVFINALNVPDADAKTMVWKLIEHLSTTLGKRLVFSGQGVQSYALTRAGLDGDVSSLTDGLDERNVRNLARGNATKATVGEFFARLKGAEDREAGERTAGRSEPGYRRIGSTVHSQRERGAQEHGRGREGAPGESGGLEQGRVRRDAAAGESGRRDVGAAETTAYAAFNATLNQNAHPEYLTRHSAEELARGRAFMTPDGHAGYAVSPDGDLQNVFRNEGAPSGSGLEAVRYAVEEEGARTLDCFDIVLPSIY